jgi:hypothetical protein
MVIKILKGLFWFFIVAGTFLLFGVNFEIRIQELFVIVVCVLPVCFFATIIYMEFDRDFSYDAVAQCAACTAIATKYANFIKDKYPDAYDASFTAIYNAVYHNNASLNKSNGDNTIAVTVVIACGFFASFCFCAGRYISKHCLVCLSLDIIICYITCGVWIINGLLFLYIEKYERKKEKNIDVFFKYRYNGDAELICPMRDKSMAQHLANYRNYFEKPHSGYKWDVKCNEKDGTYDVVGKIINNS